MLYETLIIFAYFFILMIPLATVAVFFRLDSQGKTDQLTGFDSYPLPDDASPAEDPADQTKLLPPADRHTISRCDGPDRMPVHDRTP
ncbi:hypothetical protein FIV42_25050 [Persicimonas caeni]|uniref:Uncharacterized protein n=1 Tax=Persicimonas caeni TaxID=2292766 RepID=A0A4Y6PZZ6_PERCE|nr:hypothetical protein [Persicimonas caeni]QDG53891.1 hypothetical protein FIV42_25050 [Persicimonas caeni]QED35112.1 hypothetical protein FRD00_25045 [Persicimonas caeni]